MTDYRVYHLSPFEKTEYYLCAVFLLFSLGMLFYNNVFISSALCIFSPLFLNKYAEYKCNKRKRELLEAFKDVLYSISASLACGRQMPQAIEDAYIQASMFNSILSYDLQIILKNYKELHSKLEDGFDDLARRSDLEEIVLFASSYRICRKSGGDLEEVCLKSAYLLIERIDYQSEVSAALSEKKLDIIILMIMPPAILFFLNLSSYDYISILYESVQGRIIMSLCLLLMILAIFWSLRMMKLDL